MSTTMAASRSEVAPSVALGEICRICRYLSGAGMSVQICAARTRDLPAGDATYAG
jgi:hypothetical protein